MDQSLREAKQAIRYFIRAHWTDQKLAEVLAFAQDGKMSYVNPCGCLLGVSAADTLHEDHCTNIEHYDFALKLSGAHDAERGYLVLESRYFTGTEEESREVGRRRIIPIFKAEIRRRDRMRAPAAKLLAETVAK